MIHRHDIAMGHSHTGHTLDYVLAWHRQCIANASHIVGIVGHNYAYGYGRL